MWLTLGHLIVNEECAAASNFGQEETEPNEIGLLVLLCTKALIATLLHLPMQRSQRVVVRTMMTRIACVSQGTMMTTAAAAPAATATAAVMPTQATRNLGNVQASSIVLSKRLQTSSGLNLARSRSNRNQDKNKPVV
jgi:hypothetical protein